MPHPPLILLDWSWIAYRSMHARRGDYIMRSGVRINTGMIWATHKAISDIFYSTPNADLVLCLDGRPSAHLAIQADYKANREGRGGDGLDQGVSPFDLARQFSIVPQIRIAHHPDQEADDTIAFLAATKPADQPCVVLSSDMDLRQLLDDERNVSCSADFSHSGFILETPNQCWKDHGLWPKAIPLFKAICGDSSDNIRGVHMFRKQLGKDIANACMNEAAFWRWLDSDDMTNPKHKTAKDRLRTERDLIARNLKLTNIDPLYVPEITIQHHDADLDWWEYFEATAVRASLEGMIDRQGGTR